MEAVSTIRIFPSPHAEQWIDEYCTMHLVHRDQASIEAYCRVLKRFIGWLTEQPGSQGQFSPRNITRTAVEMFLDTLTSSSHKHQARSAISNFCQWLMDEKQILERNPTRGISIPPQALLAPRMLGE
jgi:site-specific recombinase XerD